MSGKVDYLREDDAIGGQNYALVSFVSPVQEVLEKKESFLFQKYLEQKSSELSFVHDSLLKDKENKDEEKERIRQEKINKLAELFSDKDKLIKEYQNYKLCNVAEFQSEIDNLTDGRNNIRGLKVRGVYENLQDARDKAGKLQKLDGSFNIFLCSVGKWSVFDPDPNTIDNQEYMESGLNNLIKGYEENRANASQFFEDRKQELIEDQVKQNKIVEASDTLDAISENVSTSNVKDI